MTYPHWLPQPKAPYTKEVFQWHIERAWEKRKGATTENEKNYWNRIIQGLHDDFELKDFWLHWNRTPA